MWVLLGMLITLAIVLALIAAALLLISVVVLAVLGYLMATTARETGQGRLMPLPERDLEPVGLDLLSSASPLAEPAHHRVDGGRVAVLTVEDLQRHP